MPRISAAMRDLSHLPHALYRFFDRADVLLYVGITADLPQRMGGHRGEKPWWSQVTRVNVEHFATRKAALAAETIAIKDEKPLYNIQGNVLVSPPAQADIDEAVRERIGVLLRHLCISSEDYSQALARANKAIEDAALEEDDELVHADPIMLAAELKADEVSGANFLRAKIIDHLVEWLPEGQYERCRKLAEEYDKERDLEFTEDELAEQTAWFVAWENGRRYLETLAEEERKEWTEVAKAFLNHPSEPHLTFHAAHYARAYKSNRWYSWAYKMCPQVGRFNAACRNEARFMVWFQDDPACAPRPCAGHREACQEHLTALLEGRNTWIETGKPVIVARYEPIEDEQPPF
ncbi:hypothetical protein Nm8I071_49670 [Nonomuraea sp. TT08I-71]|nr:hypothetical protein Nm8I071_49670 [Nonomuraea sp. TT08I-71]